MKQKKNLQNQNSQKKTTLSKSQLLRLLKAQQKIQNELAARN